MTHKQRVLHLLSDHKPHSHHELYQLGCVAHSRVSDLRRDGHTINQWREGDLYLYQLVGALNEVAAGTPSGTALPSGRVTAQPAATSLRTPSNLALSTSTGAADPHGRDGGVLSLFGDAA